MRSWNGLRLPDQIISTQPPNRTPTVTVIRIKCGRDFLSCHSFLPSMLAYCSRPILLLRVAHQPISRQQAALAGPCCRTVTGSCTQAWPACQQSQLGVRQARMASHAHAGTEESRQAAVRAHMCCRMVEAQHEHTVRHVALRMETRQCRLRSTGAMIRLC